MSSLHELASSARFINSRLKFRVVTYSKILAGASTIVRPVGRRLVRLAADGQSISSFHQLAVEISRCDVCQNFWQARQRFIARSAAPDQGSRR
jgi:hypothetical protein